MIYILLIISVFLACCGYYLATELQSLEKKAKALEDENAILKKQLERIKEETT